MECPHYQRGCHLQAPCCGRFYPCRFCHDDAEAHEIDRHAVTTMRCRYCGAVQPVGQSCAACHRCLGVYYCDVCHLFDDDTSKQIYHCDKCGLCRRGLREDYDHCDVCGACVPKSVGAAHAAECRPGAFLQDCSVCHENIATSVTQSCPLRCGHYVHDSCLREYLRHGYYTCPRCFKSVTNMSRYFARLDEHNAALQLPPEMPNTAVIICNDCGAHGAVPNKVAHHRCESCFSYNTTLTNTEMRDPPPSAASSEHAQAWRLANYPATGSMEAVDHQ